ncbi:MAG TPA: MetQ/NlpA family ABC transporter substrate-binding protein [Tessaracoccus flavescens]|uniref:Lipoprotein n=1 Tax=Tessaracoccus flavescens TaxID=399497 RepID=A0A921JRT7_9ACTN|nr:MetQ/NlpA family ABC transporter substrate-binding protein [Tessaracoccus flavescens]
MRKILTAVAASLAATMALTACGGDTTEPAGTTSGAAGETAKVVVGASPVPHAKILEYIRDNLAADAGLEIEIKEFDDYVLPNEALASKELDANYFQHLPYLESQIAEKGYEFTPGEGVHIEPLKLLSEKHTDVAGIPDGGTIVITNDVSNQYRGLKLLESAGLLEGLAEDATVLSLTDAENPKGLKFEETQPEVVVQQVSDPKVDAAVINANFILTAGLDPNKAIASEQVAGNPYANMLVWRTGDESDAVKKLDELLHSDEVAEFIKTEWPGGDVIPG